MPVQNKQKSVELEPIPHFPKERGSYYTGKKFDISKGKTWVESRREESG